jgi:hypothetical protein
MGSGLSIQRKSVNSMDPMKLLKTLACLRDLGIQYGMVNYHIGSLPGYHCGGLQQKAWTGYLIAAMNDAACMVRLWKCILANPSKTGLSIQRNEVHASWRVPVIQDDRLFIR